MRNCRNRESVVVFSLALAKARAEPDTAKREDGITGSSHVVVFFWSNLDVVIEVRASVFQMKMPQADILGNHCAQFLDPWTCTLCSQANAFMVHTQKTHFVVFMYIYVHICMPFRLDAPSDHVKAFLDLKQDFRRLPNGAHNLVNNSLPFGYGCLRMYVHIQIPALTQPRERMSKSNLGVMALP